MSGASKKQRTYLQKISNKLHSLDVEAPSTEVEMVKLILDPTNHVDNGRVDDLMRISRDYCFQMHHRRSVLMGLGSQYRGVLTLDKYRGRHKII